MRVLVCGGRNYDNRKLVFERLDAIDAEHGGIELISGCAPGADTLADDWAAYRLRYLHPFPADWKAHGRAAGPIRNQQMIDEGKPDLVVAFPGGRGTADMCRRAEAAGVPVERITS